MWTRQELKENGKFCFRRNYWSYVAVSILLSLFVASGSVASGAASSSTTEEAGNAASSSESYAEAIAEDPAILLPALIIGIVIGVLIWILLSTVLEVGGRRFFILNRTEKAPIRTFFSVFRCGHYGNVVKCMALRDIYLTLWTLLFIVPGIVKRYEYMMIPYILADNPGMDRKEAFEISKRMMYGEKWQTFVLEWSFIGWNILSILTCGLVGIFWVDPYRNATFAELYAYNKAKAYREGYIGNDDES